MKNIFTLAALLLAFAFNASATKYTLANGNFLGQTSTTTFKDGDTLEIAAGSNVSVSASQTISANIILNVYGTLNITGNNKSLTIGSLATINVFPGGGTITGSNSTQSLYIGNNQVFTGSQNITAATTVLTATGISNGFGSGTPLPIKFISFDAALDANGMVKLNWMAISEGEVTSFTIEQSTDGQNWNDIATVKAAGSNHEMHSYNYQVAAPAGVKAVIYRVRYEGMTQTELVYSASRSISIGKMTSDVTAAVTAANNQVIVRLSGAAADGNTMVFISSMDGKLIAQQAYITEGAALNASVPAAGMYIITVTDGKSFRIAQKVVMQ
jgi:hypothetical protein